ncbi:60S ribosomal protein L27-3 [Hordeum vulgare]|nr:60S ribosomal protein L27-3 [Hordeum vulgare]
MERLVASTVPPSCLLAGLLTSSSTAPSSLASLIPGNAVVGLDKYPKKVIRKDSTKKTAKKSGVKVFLKLVNFTHLMPTRYTLDVDLKEVVSGTPDFLTTKDKKLTAAMSAKTKLEDRFKTGKNRWFFTKLRMIRHDST